MKRLSLALVLGMFALGGGSPALGVSSGLVISQVYGGGGNSGATYTHDFIEVFNRGTTLIDLTNYSVQYGSAVGNIGPNAAQITALDGFLAPGQYLLVQEAQGAGGTTPLPPPDVIDPTPISMGATAGKVALVNSTVGLVCGAAATPCGPAQLAQIVDLVGYDGSNMFEGAAPAPALSNTTAALRLNSGCQDADNNAADFVAGSPTPRNRLAPVVFSCGGDAAPTVATTNPANGATGVPIDSNISPTFAEAVNVSGAWFSIACGTSGSHTAAVSGGPQLFTLNPDVDFANSETCTVTIFASQVTDQDATDPPDNMTADYGFNFTTAAPPVEIHDIQGASHTSPLNGMSVSGVEGIVTARLGNGFYMQDPIPDADPATSEAIFVFTSSVPTANVGDEVRVSGRAIEVRPGGSGGLDNLSTTEIDRIASIEVVSSGNGLPAPTVVGTGGRIPPNMVIEDDATGNVETSGVFDPAQDGIDFYESLEAMRVQVNDALVVGPRSAFGEIPVVGDDGANAGVDTVRGGVVISPEDFNPERIILDQTITPTPVVDVADSFTTSVVGVIDYSFGSFKLKVTVPLTAVPGGLQREITRAATDHEIVVGTYNVENLDPTDGSFARHADLIVNHLRSPDLIAIEEIQDNDGAANTSVTDASVTWKMLVSAIQAAGGPTYEFRQIDPVDDQDGGEPGGNIRVGFLFRTDRGLSFTDRRGGDSTAATTVSDHPSGPRLSFSPGRVDPRNPAYDGSRKPLVGEFRMRGKKVFVIANHFSSKGGDQPLFGRFQPPQRSSELARHAQAQSVNDFVDSTLALDPHANVIVLGDINDFEFSETVQILGAGGVLTPLMETLPKAERYSYIFEGNSQVLDQMLVSENLLGNFGIEYDPVHVNSEFADQASDHDPQVARLDLRGRPTLQ